MQERDKAVRTKPSPEALRHEIDSGNTRDKVNHPDPAIAPLGTDAEAGGVPGVVSQEDEAKVAGGPGSRQKPAYDKLPWKITFFPVTLGILAVAAMSAIYLLAR